MKVIGILGGMSWESSAVYYRLLNEGVKSAKGGLHSAKVILYSVDFAQIARLQQAGDWDAAAAILAEAALKLQGAGADCVLIATNTMHKVAAEVEAVLSIPLLHIADATAEVVQERGLSTVGFLGTAFSMEQDFYTQRLAEKAGVRVLLPNEAERDFVHQVIYEQLCVGELRQSSRDAYLQIIHALAAQGAEAVILGCTEIGLLVKQADTPILLLDTTLIHAEKAVEFALAVD